MAAAAFLRIRLGMTSPTPTGLYDGFFGALRFADAFFALLAPFLAGALFFAAFFAMIGHPPRESRGHISFMAGPSGQAASHFASVLRRCRLPRCVTSPWPPTTTGRSRRRAEFAPGPSQPSRDCARAPPR